MEIFEWDENKNEANVTKHGLDFEDAAEVFKGPMLESPDTSCDYGEDRLIMLGLLEHRVVAIVYTYRNVNTVRVISMRRAKEHEKHQYEEFLNRLGTG